jgi:coenzyme F420-0:L-glutamate ligase/coenzyme F420-1:gamma-L-glutamate ligase
MPTPGPIQLLPISHIPEIRRGDNVPRILLTAAKKSKLAFQQNDILVLAQKIISKSENRLIDLAAITPSQRALDIATASAKDRTRKDARLIEIILRESRRIVREHPVLIVETHHGLVCANAGVD